MDLIVTSNIMLNSISTTNLLAAYKKLNISVALINLDECQLVLETKEILYNGLSINIGKVDYVFQVFEEYHLGLRTFNEFLSENKRVKIFNKDYEIVANKHLAYVLLNKIGITTLPAEPVSSVNYKDYTKFPYVVKMLSGPSMDDVLVEDDVALKALVEKGRQLVIYPLFIEQKEIYEVAASKREVLYTIRRTLKAGPCLANVKNKAKNEMIECPPSLDSHVERIMRALRLDFLNLEFMILNKTWVLIGVENLIVPTEAIGRKIVKSFS